jgi:hypothetical protein
MTVEMCKAVYRRRTDDVLCSYVKGHTAEHSWRTLRLSDEQEAVVTGQHDLQIGLLLEAVACGDLDRYLEAILAGCHARKRARRDVWTPPTGGTL